jgi:hypothetical protein
MAEQALYFNTKEPPFPFDGIRSKLAWLPEYLSTHTTRYTLDVYINTILVFTRARTSALETMDHWDKVEHLATKLNAAAQSIGASHHKLELFQCRGSGMFFITCRRSPRFQWTFPISHYDIGRNLDFFAPGHMSWDLQEPRCGVIFIEKRTMAQITGEAVLFRYLDTPSIREEFQRYNAARERLYNEASQQLGLDYEFKRVVVTQEALDEVAITMANPIPPTQTWWDNNCYLVNGIYYPEVMCDTKFNFCGYETQFTRYWPLLQMTFYFVIGYKRYEYRDEGSNAGQESGYCNTMQGILNEIKSVCEQTSVEDFDDIFVHFEKRLQSLAERAKLQPTPGYMTTQQPPRHNKTVNVEKLLDLRKTVRMFFFERFKLKARLVRESIRYPAEGDLQVLQ